MDESRERKWEETEMMSVAQSRQQDAEEGRHEQQRAHGRGVSRPQQGGGERGSVPARIRPKLEP